MKAPPVVLRPPQHQRTRDRAHDSELDRMITNHRRRHAGRFAMLGLDHRALMGRYLNVHHTTTTWRS